MRGTWLLVIALGVLLAAWIGWGFFGSEIATWFTPAVETKVDTTGQWGDSFGAFNAFVSTIGSAAVLTTLWVQGRAIKDQASDLHEQRFESTFFELIRILRELREAIRFTPSDEYRDIINHRGGEIINFSDGSVMHKLVPSEEFRGYQAITKIVAETSFWSDNNNDQIKDIFTDKLYQRNENVLSPYFRIIYTVIRRIKDDSILNYDDKVRYANLLRSQLTSDEVTLLAINGLTEVSNDLDKLLIEYRMLKYLPNSPLREKLREEYGPKAFMSRP